MEIIKALYFAPFIFYATVYLLFTVGATREKRHKKNDDEGKGDIGRISGEAEQHPEKDIAGRESLEIDPKPKTS
jgi:hypothetical protein